MTRTGHRADEGSDTSESLGSKAKRGAVWSLVSYGASQAIRLASNILLTRMLFEEAFGLMALVAVFLMGLQLFSDVGIGPSIIQNERGDDPDFLNTAWTIQVARGFALWACSLIGGIPFAAFYGEPVLAYIIPVSGATAAISGFNSTKLFTANRHLAMGRLAAIDVASQLATSVAMVAWALHQRSVWALVAGSVVGAVVRMILSHLALPGAGNRFRWNADAVSRLARFGRWIFASTVLTFFTSQSDRLIFGKMIPTDQLGVYSVGIGLASLPTVVLGHIAGSVLFPAYSRVVQSGGPLPVVFRRMRLPMMVLAGWGFSVLIATGQLVVNILYDARYSGAGWIVQFTAVAGWFTALESATGAALLARGQANMLAAAGAVKLVALVCLILLGHEMAGFPGAVAGYVGSEAFRYAVAVWAGRRAGLRALTTDVLLSGTLILTALFGLLVERFMASTGCSNVVSTGVVGVATTVLWVPWAYKAARR